MRGARAAIAASALCACATPPPLAEGPDIEQFLAQPVDAIPGYSRALVRSEDDRGLLDARDTLEPRRTPKLPDFRVWRRMLAPVAARSGDAYRFVVVRYRADTDRVWYIDVPVERDGAALRIGKLATTFAYDDCVRALGQPQRVVQRAPVVRIAWWDVGDMTYRVEFFTERHEDRKRGEVQSMAVYRRSLAPDGFDDMYDFWKDLAGRS